MDEVITKILNNMENEMVKDFQLRKPSPNETPEEKDCADDLHEMDFFKAKCFKLGVRLGLEISRLL